MYTLNMLIGWTNIDRSKCDKDCLGHIIHLEKIEISKTAYFASVKRDNLNAN